MAGSSGFLGSRLRRRLVADGHDIVQLVRREPQAPDQRRWWPDRGELDPAHVAGADAVVNLAGAGVEDRRWTRAYKELLWSSRVEPTTTLARALADLPEARRPRTMLQASGIHHYGDRGDEPIDENTPPGTGYFPELCQAWEGATAAADEAGVRVVYLRTGLPLDARGGLLRPFMITFRLFVGGRLASGRQWMPWISMRDWLSATTFLLSRDDIAGPVNCVGPAPVRNTDFTRALAKVLRRPAITPVPRFALRAVLGEFADEAVASLRALPGVLNRAGFSYHDPDVESALRAAVRQREAGP